MSHSSRADTCKLTPSQCAYRRGHWRYWLGQDPFILLVVIDGKYRYQADHVYGHATIYFVCATICVFMLARIVGRVRISRMHSGPLLRRCSDSIRYLEYKSFRILVWVTPSLGVLLLLGAGIIYFSALTLGPRPYYWPNTSTTSYGSSPPIATPSGWLLLYCLLSLPSVAKPTTFLCLPVFRTKSRTSTTTMFVLALIHTSLSSCAHPAKARHGGTKEYRGGVLDWGCSPHTASLVDLHVC
jgi:ferric-chelate reductase